jgi:undecaprenyl-diphosphatase
VEHLTHATSSSFPSGHATLSAVAYLTLGLFLARVTDRRRGKVIIISGAVFITMLVGASRVYLGVHWPSDVLAGWCIGAAWAAIWWVAAYYLAPPHPATKPENP